MAEPFVRAETVSVPASGNGMTSANGMAATMLHGLIRLGALRIAVPADAIREVIPFPLQLEPFVAPRREIIGAVEVRGQLVPVLDLETALGMDLCSPAVAGTGSASEGRWGIVAILRHAGSVFGIAASGIEGVFNLEDAMCHPITVAGDDAAAFVVASFARPGGSGLVVDPASLASLPGLPLSRDAARRRDRQEAAGEPILIFTVGGLRCALPTACVDASIPERSLAPAPIADPLWFGFIAHKGDEIPIIDTLALLEQAGGPSHDRAVRRRSGAVVLRCDAKSSATTQDAGPQDKPAPAGLVALMIDSVDDIVRVEFGMVAPLAHGLDAAPLVAGMINTGHGPCLLLDGGRLAADLRLITLGAVKQRSDLTGAAADRAGVDRQDLDATGSSDAEGGRAREAFLVYETDGCVYATALSGVEEIVPYGGDLVLLEEKGGLSGLLRWRGSSVPLLPLRTQASASRGDGAFIIIARQETDGEIHRAGFRVDALRAVERKPRQILGRGSMAGLLDVTIRLDDGNACSVVDLGGIARKTLARQAAASTRHETG